MKDIIYEQPLNEQVRLCLRLEYLFGQAAHYINGRSVWDSHQMLKIILEILQTIERSDIKNKFCQTLNQYIHILTKLEKLQEIDQQKLNNTLKQIVHLIDGLHANPKKIGQELRENEFLNSIQQRLHVPAGTCYSNLPPYHLWLQKELPARKQQLLNWYSHFSQLQEIVEIVLKLIREGTAFKENKAPAGFYQDNLDQNISYQMIRTKIHTDKNLFPEISVGRYRFTIHFFNIDIEGKTSQTPDDVSFKLACCKM